MLLSFFQTNGHLPGNGEVYQERLARLENDKESLVLQASDFKMLFFFTMGLQRPFSIGMAYLDAYRSQTAIRNKCIDHRNATGRGGDCRRAGFAYLV